MSSKSSITMTQTIRRLLYGNATLNEQKHSLAFPQNCLANFKPKILSMKHTVMALILKSMKSTPSCLKISASLQLVSVAKTDNLWPQLSTRSILSLRRNSILKNQPIFGDQICISPIHEMQGCWSNIFLTCSQTMPEQTLCVLRAAGMILKNECFSIMTTS